MSRIVIAKDEWMEVEMENNPHAYLLHFNTFSKPPLSAWRQWKVDWEEIKNILAQQGINRLFGLIEIGKKAAHKLAKMFGFAPILTLSNCILYEVIF